jgi:hypothetical protein
VFNLRLSNNLEHTINMSTGECNNLLTVPICCNHFEHPLICVYSSGSVNGICTLLGLDD